jgi:hypothetical protein
VDGGICVEDAEAQLPEAVPAPAVQNSELGDGQGVEGASGYLEQRLLEERVASYLCFCTSSCFSIFTFVLANLVERLDACLCALSSHHRATARTHDGGARAAAL